MLLFDPQTSGGLLLAVPLARKADFCQRMAAVGEPFRFIGEVIEGAGILVLASRG
jgi:selenide,water dikinase